MCVWRGVINDLMMINELMTIMKMMMMIMIIILTKMSMIMINELIMIMMMMNAEVVDEQSIIGMK